MCYEQLAMCVELCWVTGRDVDIELGDDDSDEEKVLDMRTSDLDDEEFGIE